MFSALTVLLTLLLIFNQATAFTSFSRAMNPTKQSEITKLQGTGSNIPRSDLTADPCTLPGDPSLILNTNVDLGEQKIPVMKTISKAMSEFTGKPESYISVMLNDKQSLIWGGDDQPCALGNMCSIGSIAMESNGKISKAVSDCLSAFGVPADRIYINFFDVPRANVGWNGKTFAG